MLKSTNTKIMEKVGHLYVEIWLCGNVNHKPPHIKILPYEENSLEDDSRLSKEIVAEILKIIKSDNKQVGETFCIDETFRPEVEKLLAKNLKPMFAVA